MKLRYLKILYPDGTSELVLQQWNQSERMWVQVMEYIVNAGQEFWQAVNNPSEDPSV